MPLVANFHLLGVAEKMNLSIEMYLIIYYVVNILYVQMQLSLLSYQLAESIMSEFWLQKVRLKQRKRENDILSLPVCSRLIKTTSNIDLMSQLTSHLTQDSAPSTGGQSRFLRQLVITILNVKLCL